MLHSNVGDKRKAGHATDHRGVENDTNSGTAVMADECCDLVLDTSSCRSGLLTCRKRSCDIPRMKLTRYYRIRLEYSETGSEKYPDFADMPGWLKPFLYYHHQLGCRAERLRNLFLTLPDDLLSAIRTACTAVVVLALNRMRIARESASLNPMCSDNGWDKWEDEPWFYEGLGISDEELDTFDHADFGVVRYLFTSSSLSGPTTSTSISRPPTKQPSTSIASAPVMRDRVPSR